MIDLFKEAAALQDLLEKNGKEFFFVGGIALQRWGQPRLTTDIDLTVFTNLREEHHQLQWLLRHYASRHSSPEKAIEFALISRVLLLETRERIGIDVMLGGLADISTDLAMATYEEFTPSISLKVCSAESLIAFKAIAGRPKDMADLESVIIKQTRLDWDYIWDYLDQVNLYQDISAHIENLKRLKTQYYQP